MLNPVAWPPREPDNFGVIRLFDYARAIRPFRRTEEAMGGDFGERRFVAELRRDSAEWLEMLRLLDADFSRAWKGRASACCEDANYCFDLEDRSEYAAHFTMEYAALGASIKETVKEALDLHDALDREHHLMEEPADLAMLHFAAVYPDRGSMAA